MLYIILAIIIVRWPMFALAQTSNSHSTDFDSIVGNQVPDSLDGLIEKLKELDQSPNSPDAQSSAPGMNSSFVLQNHISELKIPFSRSLQAPVSDLKNPRTVLSVTRRGSRTPPSFVGYEPKTGQGEVISWNPQEARYEFKIIENLAPGKKPIVKMADRQLCVKCHQGEGPIFPHFPWSETNFNQNIRKALSLPKSDDNPLAFGNASGVDQDVRDANAMMQTTKICKELCTPSDLSCKKALIFGSLLKAKQLYFPTSFSSSPSLGLGSGSFLPDQRIFSALSSALRGRDFSYPSSVIPDRVVDLKDPSQSQTTVFRMNDPEIAAKFRQHQTGFIPAKNASEMVAVKGYATYSDSFSSTDFTSLNVQVHFETYDGVKPNEPSSPLFIRPKIGQVDETEIATRLPEIGSSCITPPSLPSLEKASIDQIEDALFSDKADVLVKGTIDWSKLNTLIASTKVQPKPQASECHFGTEPDFKDLKAITEALEKNATQARSTPHFTSVQREQAHGLLKKYCSSCHDAGKPIALGINFSDLNAFKTYHADDGDSISKKIRTSEMPPKGEPQPTQEERTLMSGVLSE